MSGVVKKSIIPISCSWWVPSDGWTACSGIAGRFCDSPICPSLLASSGDAKDVVLSLVCTKDLSLMSLGNIRVINGFRVGMQAHMIPTLTSTADHIKDKDAYHAKSF